MNGVKSLSLIAGKKVDTDTGEITEISFNKTQTNKQITKIITTNYTQSDIDIARNVISSIGERVLKIITKGKKAAKNNKGYDLLLNSGNQMEVKVGRIGSSATIKKHQLNYLDNNGFYGILYYRTFKNKAPTYYVAKNKNPECNLKKNISIESVFIFPKKDLVRFYNTSDLLEGKITTTGLTHKPLCYKRAKKIFQDNIFEQETFQENFKYRKSLFTINSIGYKV